MWARFLKEAAWPPVLVQVVNKWLDPFSLTRLAHRRWQEEISLQAVALSVPLVMGIFVWLRDRSAPALLGPFWGVIGLFIVSLVACWGLDVWLRYLKEEQEIEFAIQAWSVIYCILLLCMTASVTLFSLWAFRRGTAP